MSYQVSPWCLWGKLRGSDQSSCWPGPILNRIFYPKSWQIIFTKDDKTSYLFSSFVFSIRTPSLIPSYPKPVKHLFSLPRSIPTIQPSSVQYTRNLRCSFSHYLIFCLWAFSALVPLTELRGHCSIQNRLCTEVSTVRRVAFTNLMI